MEFKSKKELDSFLKTLIPLDTFGSQGCCYIDRKKEYAYKIFHEYFDNELDLCVDFKEEHLLQFQDIRSEVFAFPVDIITLKGIIVGYIMPFMRGTNLYKTNPLDINLDWLISLILPVIAEIKRVTNLFVNCYDVMYNVLLGSKISIIDTQDYSRKVREYNELLDWNLRGFNLELMYFLVDGIFDEIISSNAVLMEMLKSNGHEVNIIDFIIELKAYLKSLLSKEISCLRDANPLINDNIKNNKYEREIILRK